MNELHVGRGTTRGGMTVFPVWAKGSRHDRLTAGVEHLAVTECEDGATVSALTVTNPGPRPVLVLEGQLFEGGWQHRMATTSVLVAPGARMTVEVACVEERRWGGDAGQLSRGRRATPYVRDAVRAAGDVQGEVWRRVETHTRGTDNVTGSLARRLDQADCDLAGEFPALPGQSGVLIGVGGQPLVMEVFDSHRTLCDQLPALLQAAALDAQLAPPARTPSRRALRFVHELERVWMHQTAPAGLAEQSHGRSERVDASVLAWEGRDLHLRASHLAHPLLVAGGAL